MRRLFALASLLALVAVACKIETNFGAVINADGSGTIVIELGMDEEAQGFFMSEVDDPFEDQEFADMPGARTRQERRGDMDFWIVEVDVDDITAFQDDIVSDENSMLDTFSITITEDRVTVQGTASAEETFGGGEGFDPQLVEDSISANIRITMPGAITSHNATSQSGNTLTWAVPVLGGGLDIRAESDPRGTPAAGDGGGGGLPTALIVGIAAAVVAGGLFVLMRRRGAGAPAAVTAEGPGAPEPPPTDE